MADSPHLLLISLGPVQDFIHTARKCQDLWFGSWLLSEMASVVAEHLGRAGQGTVLVFPASRVAEPSGGEAEKAGVANKILARLPAGLNPRRIAESAREAQQKALLELFSALTRHLENDEFFQAETARAQVEDLMEFLWVSVPEKGGYREALHRAEALLAARKNTRTWHQPEWPSPEGVPKSALDGERESVIHTRAFKALSARQLLKRYGVRPNEHLCGVGLLKRLGCEVEGDLHPRLKRRPAFHSSSHVAMAPLAERVAQHEADFRVYEKALEEAGVALARSRLSGPRWSLFGYDAGILMPHRLRDLLEESGVEGADIGQRLPKLERASKQLLGAVGRPGDPCPYYVFLMADGDRMGQLISTIDRFEGHQALTRALSSFSLQARRIVEEQHRGTLIFSGGDDVLALLPLHRALDCAQALARAFHATLAPVAPRGHAPTLSAGLAIAHALEPMEDVRRLAARAETRAKSLRDAIAVILSPRSGFELESLGSWGEDPSLPTRLEAWMQLLEHLDLSNSTAHDLQGVAEHYAALDDAAQKQRREEILALVKQVLARKRQRHGAEAVAAETQERLLAGIDKSEHPARAVATLADELQIARQYLRARRDAGEATRTTP